MTSRTESSLDLVCGRDCFCDSEERLLPEYLFGNSDVPSVRDEGLLEEMRKETCLYLTKTLALSTRLGVIHERKTT